MKKITLSDFQKDHTKKADRWLSWVSLSLMLLLGSSTMTYGQGNTCIDPLNIQTLPYTNAGNTGTFGNDYTSTNRPPIAVGAVNTSLSTGSASYLNGFEVVYSITPIINGQITVSTTNDDGWMALWAFTGCPFTSTVGLHTSTSGSTRTITNLPVLANNTYYLVFSSWDPPGVNFTINVIGTAGLLAPLTPCTGLPNGGVASITPNTGNAGAAIMAKATGTSAASGLTYQWQKEIGGTWQDIAGATTVNSSITAEAGAIGTVINYILAVTCTASSEVAYSTTATYTIALTYCTPVGGANNTDEIKNFTLSNLNNTSAPSEGIAGYKSYVGLVAPAQLQLGLPLVASITGGTGSGNHGAAIWIDYNKNGTFETSEKVAFIPNTIAPNATANFPQFTVPAGTPLGLYRLRVQHQYNKSGELLDPCTVSSINAETEDYSVEVLPVPTCLQPQALAASNITFNSADLSWTSAGTSFELQYGLQGFVLGSGTILTGISSPYTLNTGLTPATSYSFYVRQNCGAADGFSLWTGPFTFKTACAPVSSFLENFDSYALTGEINPLPNCWTRFGNTASSYITTSSVSPLTPPNKLYLSATATGTTQLAVAVMPQVTNLQAGTHRLRFKAYASSAGKTMEVGYYDTANLASSFVFLEAFTLPSTQATATEFFYIPQFVPSAVQSLVFRVDGAAATGTTTVYIDDVAWEQIPACGDITEVIISDITSSAAVISWIDSNSAPAWQYVYAPSTVTNNPATLTPIDANNPFVSLMDLATNTTYSIWIRTKCGVAAFGNWSSVRTFTTLCGISETFTQNFDSSLTGSTNPLPACWTRAGNGNTYVTSGGVAPGTPPNRLYMLASGVAPATQAIAIMPAVSNLQANTHRLKFKAFTSSSANGRSVEIGYFSDVTDLSTFTVIQTVNLPGTASSTAQTFTIYPTNIPPGIKSIAFRNVGTPLASTTLYIDDVVWEPNPSVAPVCATNLLATPNATCGNFATVLTWDAAAEADGYNLTIGTTAGASNVLPTQNIGLVTSYNFIGNVGTTYFYTLSPFNLVGPAAGCVEKSFTTVTDGCYCPSVPTSNDNNGITNVKLGTQNFVNGDVMYFNHTATLVDLIEAVPSNLKITFGTGYDYGTNVWIDFNNNFTFEESELVYTGLSNSANPSILDATFLMPADAPLGSHRMRIVATDIVQIPANPCYGGSYGVTLDFQINITVAPSCFAPSGVSFEATTLTATGVTINWNAATTAATDGYDYYISTTNAAPLNNAVPSGSVAAGITTKVLTGLLPVTTYYVWVRSKCSDTDVSSWSISTSFTTSCASYDAPFGQNFATYLPSCWSTASAGTIASGPTNTLSGIWGDDGFLNNGSTGSARINLYSTNRIGWLITPVMNTNIGEPYVFKFNYGVTAFSGTAQLAMGSDDSVKVAMSTDNGVTWTEIKNFTSVDNITNTSQDYQYTFNATTNKVKFAFIGTDGTIDDIQDFNFYIDNVVLENTLSTTAFDTNVFTAYPNPVKDKLNIRYTENITDVAVFNLLGQQLFTKQINATQGQVDMSNLTSGTYLVRVTSGEKVQTLKVIKE
jgi:hypothetical protein